MDFSARRTSPFILTRRAFLRRSAAGAVGVAAASTLAEEILADPYARLDRRAREDGFLKGAPIRVRGRVRAEGRGVGRVAVSDGMQVVETAPDGAFELVTTSNRQFVWMSVPSGHRIPTSEVGTSRFYQAIDPRRSEMDVTFDLEPLRTSDERHVLVLLGDIQTQDDTEMGWFHERSVPDLQQTIAALGDIESFGIACGDIMYDRLELYPEYERGVSRIGIPFWQVIGNHDLDMDAPTDEASTATYSRHFGPRYYSFDRGAVHYVVLDDVHWHGSGYLGYLGADALTWLEQDLARVERGGPVIVATHIPVTGSRHVREGRRNPEVGSAIMNREALFRLLEPFDAHVLTGHTHECEHVFEGGVHEHVTGAVCGAWWSGPICWDGTPNGYCLYEVDGSEVTWRYKATGESADHQMRLYAPGSDPSAPGRVVANVWNWDPEWTVRWFADGEPRGSMERRTGLDPLSIELHTGDSLPRRRTWVDPILTNHRFLADVRTGVREVTVEATDRFGRNYAETLVL